MYFQVDFIIIHEGTTRFTQYPVTTTNIFLCFYPKLIISISGVFTKLNCAFMQKRQGRKFYTFLDIFLIVAQIYV